MTRRVHFGFISICYDSQLVLTKGGAVQGRRRTEVRAQMLALAGVLFLLVAAETAREMIDAEPGASVVSNLGYAVAEAFSDAYIVAAVALVIGVVVYLLSYLRGE